MASQTVLVINGYDFRDYLAEDAISQSYSQRLSHDVVTLDGYSRRFWIDKINLDVTLLDLPHNEMIKVHNRLNYGPQYGLCLVTFMESNGLMRTDVPMYLTGYSRGIKKVYPGTNGVFWSGVSFTLEER